MAYPYGFGVVARGPRQARRSRSRSSWCASCAASGAPLVNITIGNPYFNPHVNRPFDLPTSGAPLPAENPAGRRGALRRHRAHASRKPFPDMAVIGGGYSWLRQFFPNVAAANVRKGWVSLVGAGRMAFAYPDFARDLARPGAARPAEGLRGLLRLHPDHARRRPHRLRAARCRSLRAHLQGRPRRGARHHPRRWPRPAGSATIPTCVTRCPAQVNIPKFVGHIAAARVPRGLRDAARVQRAGRRLRLRLPVGDAVRIRLHQRSTTPRPCPSATCSAG